MNKNALIVFLKDPQKSKVKTRLAKDIGQENAEIVYSKLLKHTESVVSKIEADVFAFYYPDIPKSRILSSKKDFRQKGQDLGGAMKNAFQTIFDMDYSKVLIIGSDCFEIQKKHLIQAFDNLDSHDFVFGPSLDGGYYLLGMKELGDTVFENIDWSTEKVLDQSLEKLRSKKVCLLEELNDIDTVEDLNRESGLQL